MKISTKVVATAIASLIIGVVISVIVADNIFLTYIRNEEEKIVQQNYTNVSLILDSEKKVIERTQSDWTQWDETYDFIEGKDDAYIARNLGESTVKELNLYGMIFMDEGFNKVYSDNSGNLDADDVCNKIISKVKTNTVLEDVTLDNMVSGITVIDDKVFLVSLAGITTSNGEADINGYLIMIRELDNKFVEYMENILNTKINIELGTTDSEYKGLLYDKFALIDTNIKGDMLNSRAEIKNILDNNCITVSLEIERASYKKAVESFKIFIYMTIIIFVVTISMCVFGFNKLVIKRVLKLSKFVDKVMENNDVSLKLEVSGKDEISNLGNNINNMLEKLDKSFTDIRKNDERLHLIMEATTDGYFDYDVSARQVTISLSWKKHLGYSGETNIIDYREVLNYIVEEDRNKFKETAKNYLFGEKDNFTSEIRIYRANRGYVWVSVRGKVVNRNKSGTPLRWIGIVSDITERKFTEMQNVYLLQTDPVTNLKNRAYMENILKNISKDRSNDFCILMADVNGLKLMNDAFGHLEGDRLLKTVGDILKICCLETDIPVRWGGDEFLILIRNSKKYADDLLKKIKSECLLVDSFPIKLNLAMGWAAESECNFSIEEVVMLAEKRMYQNKLLETKSVRKSIISSLEQSLKEKQVEYKGHSERVKEICLRIGKRLNLTQDELDELSLLSQLHDIGKIAIPDYILRKSEELTEEEMNIMKTHTEIGCRIARSISDLSKIADKILSHHERYDGKGFPRGLEKANIPKASRILAIADQFDVRTNGTIYKEPISIEEALTEIENNSGTKFDPELVKVFLGIYKEEKMML